MTSLLGIKIFSGYRICCKVQLSNDGVGTSTLKPPSWSPYLIEQGMLGYLPRGHVSLRGSGDNGKYPMYITFEIQWNPFLVSICACKLVKLSWTLSLKAFEVSISLLIYLC
jgi:hypothetical protein